MAHVLGQPGRPPCHQPAGRAILKRASHRRLARGVCRWGGVAVPVGSTVGGSVGLPAATAAPPGWMSLPRARARAGPGDLTGAGLVVLTSLQFGGVVVLGKIVTDAGLSIPAFLAIRFAAAALLL